MRRKISAPHALQNRTHGHVAHWLVASGRGRSAQLERSGSMRPSAETRSTVIAASDNRTRCGFAFILAAGTVHTLPSRSISFHRTPRASPPRSRSQDGELKAERPDPGSRANRRRIRASPATSTRRGGYSSERIENWYAQWCEMSDVARQDRQSVVLCRRRDDDVGYSRRLALSARAV
jgi:hypothetical protein